MDKQTVSIRQACELVGVSPRTIYNWLSSGKIEYIQDGGSLRVRIFAETLWRGARSVEHTTATTTLPDTATNRTDLRVQTNEGPREAQRR